MARRRVYRHHIRCPACGSSRMRSAALNGLQIGKRYCFRCAVINESEVNPTGTDGSAFRIVVSQRTGDDFSVMLLAILDKPVVPNRPEFPLLRYDDAGHTHSNALEGDIIRRKPHIHRATERYQKATNQRRPDGYAVATARLPEFAASPVLFPR